MLEVRLQVLERLPRLLGRIVAKPFGLGIASTDGREKDAIARLDPGDHAVNVPGSLVRAFNSSPVADRRRTCDDVEGELRTAAGGLRRLQRRPRGNVLGENPLPDLMDRITIR